MDDRYKTKKYGTDKIALLGLFVIALLIAYFITVSKSDIVLSDPIKLQGSGLSVSLPTGSGWHVGKQWVYSENSFTLSSILATTPSASRQIMVQCQYLLVPRRTDVNTQIQEKASAIGAEILKTEEIYNDMITVNWAHMEDTDSLYDTFYGTIELPNSRHLDIEILFLTTEIAFAEKIFRTIVQNLEFEDNGLLSIGAEIIDRIKSVGLSSLLYNIEPQSYFLIKDIKKRTIGFTIDVLVDTGTDIHSNIRAGSFFYLSSRYPTEQITTFHSDNSFNRFAWRSETTSITERTGAEIVFDDSGIMTVRKTPSKSPEQKYYLSPTAIPEVFFEIVLSQMLEMGYKEIIVDIIDSHGKIIPVRVSRIGAPASAGKYDESVTILKLDFLNQPRLSQEIHLDEYGRISKRLLLNENVILERTTEEDILIKFPKRSKNILKKMKPD